MGNPLQKYPCISLPLSTFHPHQVIKISLSYLLLHHNSLCAPCMGGTIGHQWPMQHCDYVITRRYAQHYIYMGQANLSIAHAEAAAAISSKWLQPRTAAHTMFSCHSSTMDTWHPMPAVPARKSTLLLCFSHHTLLYPHILPPCLSSSPIPCYPYIYMHNHSTSTSPISPLPLYSCTFNIHFNKCPTSSTKSSLRTVPFLILTRAIF